MTPRGASALGLALAAAVAAWWLGAVAVALQGGTPVAPLARDLLVTLLAARAIAIAVVGVETGRAAGWRDGAGALALVAAAGWPLVLLGQWASGVAPIAVVAAEAGLLALAAGVAALGGLLRRTPVSLDALRPAAHAAGLLLASALWWQRALWLAWLPA